MWKQKRTEEIYDYLEGSNFNYTVTVFDYKPFREFVLSHEPDKKKGIAYSTWKKTYEAVLRYYSVYRMIVEFDHDDDAIMTRDFENKDEAELVFEELVTTNIRPTFEGFV